MNAITTLILTVSLLVLAESPMTQKQVESNAGDTPPSKIVLNHNETMLTVR